MPRKPKPAGRFIAVYVRASTTSQDLRSQEPDLKRWADAQAEPVVFYRDKCSGTSMDRPGWNRLDADLKAGLVSTIACWRIDRLGRTSRGLTALFEDLVKAGVGLVSLREGLDLLTPVGRMVGTLLAGVAQFETEIRSERQRAGIDAAKAGGMKFGRPAVKPGESAKRIKVRPEQEEMVRKLAGAGESKASIARVTGLSRPTVYSILAGFL